MKLSPHKRTARGGFTLVELLIVIAIIGLLIGLLAAAVIKALSTGRQTQNMADIRKMDAVVVAFQTQFKVSHIPSQIILCKYSIHYQQLPPQYQQLGQDSLAWLNQVWPRLGWSSGQGAATIYRRIDWNGLPNGGPPTPMQPQVPPLQLNVNYFVLEGGQCLVYFLGGIPEPVGSPPGTKGFSTNPLDPTAPTAERVAPFYEFKSNRLVRATPTDPFFFYLDTYGSAGEAGSKAYAYFSSYGRRNGYNRYINAPGRTDCRNVAMYGGGVWPVAQAPGDPLRYMNPDTFQITSAGANQQFGPATNLAILPVVYWSPQNPGQAYSGSTAGADDQANFHSLVLGASGE